MKTRNDNGRWASNWTRTRRRWRRRRRRRQGKHEERTKKKEKKERKTEICWSMIYTRRRKIVERAVAPSWWLVCSFFQHVSSPRCQTTDSAALSWCLFLFLCSVVYSSNFPFFHNFIHFSCQRSNSFLFAYGNAVSSDRRFLFQPRRPNTFQPSCTFHAHPIGQSCLNIISN